MRTPMFIFRQKATVKKYVGNTSVGPKYEESVERCRMEYRNRLVVNENGNNITSPAKALFPNDAGITIQSIVVHDGREFKVTEVKPHFSFSGVSYVEAILI